MAPSALEKKIQESLDHREQSARRRRLPDPNNSPSSIGSALIDFNSNDYLSLSTSRALRTHLLRQLNKAPDILGSGGSRLLVNGGAHADLEARLSAFFNSEAALLFNSGFDANVGFFSAVPQPGDVIIYDEYIHASVHDGMRASRIPQNERLSFEHNSTEDIRRVLLRSLEMKPALKSGEISVFVAVESLYSMDGTFAPLQSIVLLLDELFPLKNAYLVVDEAHSTGIYGPQGKGRVALLGLENRVFARLHTFGKALAATGAVILTNVLVRDYLLNYARSLIYTTSLSYANIIAANCSFDMLSNGTTELLANRLFGLSSYFVNTLENLLKSQNISAGILSLSPHQHGCNADKPSHIIPILTPHPVLLSAHLLSLGMNVRAIMFPTVRKGKERVRICLHSGNTKEEVDRLIFGIVTWAEERTRSDCYFVGLLDNDVRSKL